MLKIGIICPVPHLSDFALQSDFHLILPHLFDKYPAYFEFYRERASQGDFVLMDSSIFELDVSMPGEFLLEKAYAVGASEMTTPEVLRDADASKAALEKFLDLYHRRGATIPLFAVTQGKSLEEMLQYFRYLESISEIATIGIPFDLDFPSAYSNVQSLTLRRLLNRWEIVTQIQDSIMSKKPVHLLGLSDGVELQYYKNIPWIRSNDSSSAFVHGAAGILYGDRGLPCEKISTKLDFSTKLTTSTQVESILYNIRKLKQFAGYATEPSRT